MVSVSRAGSWPDYGGSPDQSKYVVTRDITKQNVVEARRWRGCIPPAMSAPTSSIPLIVDNVMYVLAKNSSLVAIDVITHQELWIHANLRGITNRGINYWESRDRKDRRLLFTLEDTLQAIDARTGKSILSFGKDGVVDLREGLGRDPATIRRVASATPGRVFENLLILGSSPGEGYFSAPGPHPRLRRDHAASWSWTFHTIPQPGEFGYDTWPKDAWKYAGGVNVWGEITLDAKRGIAYFPVASPTYDYYGADRIGMNLFSDCLLALDARTGKRLWHFQMVHHDLWDYDPTAAPQLITVRKDGKKIDAVAQATKQGFVFVFDRVTGKPVWPIEERAGAEERRARRAGLAHAAVLHAAAIGAAAGQARRSHAVSDQRRRARGLARAHLEGAHRPVHSAGADRDAPSCRARWAAPTGATPRPTPAPACSICSTRIFRRSTSCSCWTSAAWRTGARASARPSQEPCSAARRCTRNPARPVMAQIAAARRPRLRC